jgi:hypothetical protein
MRLEKLHNEELYKFTHHHNYRMMKSKMRWVGNVALTREMRNAYKIFVEKPEGKRSLIRPRRRWDRNIKMDF